MSFFQRRKSQEDAEHIWNSMSKDTRKLYFTYEFQSLGDMTKNGNMNIHEFNRLMSLLGYPKGKEGSTHLWKSRGKPDGARMTQDEYVSMMFDAKIESKTNMWRKLFAEIDTDGTGFGTKDDVLKGLEKMGLPINDRMKAKVDDMDIEKTNKVTYIAFLKEQLKQY